MWSLMLRDRGHALTGPEFAMEGGDVLRPEGEPARRGGLQSDGRARPIARLLAASALVCLGFATRRTLALLGCYRSTFEVVSQAPQEEVLPVGRYIGVQRDVGPRREAHEVQEYASQRVSELVELRDHARSGV